MEAVARLRNCPTSPRKMRLVADTIRGMDVEEAMNILGLMSKEAAGRVEKLLWSAVHNWRAKNEGIRLEESDLFVKEIFVDSARMLKRYRPAPMGRAHRIRKRSNHVTIVVDSRIPVMAEEVAEPEVKKVKEAPKTKKKEKKKEASKKKESKAKKETPKKEAKSKEGKKEVKKADKGEQKTQEKKDK